jgi:hypothetical protein
MYSYQYQPLRYNDSVRILILHPSSNQAKPIICTIQHIRLSDMTINYEALSYTWGDTSQKEVIHFHDGSKDLLVGRTCHDALRNLRQETTYRLLWIDAICINQDDISERNHQVRMMDYIYNRAFKVVVFLGEHAAGSRVLFEELAAADKFLAMGKEVHRPSPNHIVIQELERLYTRPWFKRVWVIQEVCMKPSVIFMCGSASASYSALSKLDSGYSHTKVTKMRRPGVLNWVRTPREDFSTPQLSLWHRLHESRYCLATDPRDRVFAMKSLVGSRQSELDLLIDYSLGLEECFIGVAKFFLPVLGLRMLTAIRHPHDKNMPSWVPDWSQNLPLHPHYRGSKEPVEHLKSEHRDIFQSATKNMHEIRMTSGSKDRKRLELRTQGFQYAHVINTSQEFSFKDIEETEIQMRRLYYGLGNLRNIFDVGKVQDNHKVLEHLGKDIAKGKCTELMQLPETERAISYVSHRWPCSPLPSDTSSGWLVCKLCVF